MSQRQQIAAMRWLILCLGSDKPVTFEQAKEQAPRLFDFTREDRELNIRNEPIWLMDLRNFKRTVGEGKNPHYARVGDGLALTELGREVLCSVVSREQMAIVARLRKPAA